MCWQGTPRALFQLHGIKHWRYARQGSLLKKGKNGLQSSCPPLPQRVSVFYLRTVIKQKKVLFWQTVEFSVQMFFFFFFVFNKAVLTILCILLQGYFDFMWLVSLIKMSERIRLDSECHSPRTCFSFWTLGWSSVCGAAFWHHLHRSGDSWSAYSCCQHKILYLNAPFRVKGPNLLSHPPGVFIGNEVTPLEKDHKHTYIMRCNWKELKVSKLKTRRNKWVYSTGCKLRGFRTHKNCSQVCHKVRWPTENIIRILRVYVANPTNLFLILIFV